MSERKWTAEQAQVIALQNRNLLVSAAAGSGKTAALVARIVRMLTEPSSRVNIDELLVVTFTNAAASEMRERIGLALEQAVLADPKNEQLQKQLRLLHSAQISTIHSFCLEVIHSYSHLTELDPEFRIGDEAELTLLRRDVLREVLEEQYTLAEPDFLRFVEAYTPTKSDAVLEDLVLRLYELRRSLPPWQRGETKCSEALAEGGLGSETANGEQGMAAVRLEERSFLPFLLRYLKLLLTDMCAYAETALALCTGDLVLKKYTEVIQGDLEQIKALREQQTYQALYEAFSSISFVRMPTVRAEHPQKEMVKQLRDTWKKAIIKLKEEFFCQAPEQAEADMEAAEEAESVLERLTECFAASYEEKKRARNLVDFTDLEQVALQILVELRDGEPVPTAAARALSEQYVQILIDEYQDINYLQESILNSISREWNGSPNLFMVGDVKQSIYRFRQARPELFVEKYQAYSAEESLNQRIVLSKNFRSRSSVLAAVNFLFCRLMREELGRITYGAQEALYPGRVYPALPEMEAWQLRTVDCCLIAEEAGLPVEQGSVQTTDAREQAAQDSTQTTAVQKQVTQVQQKKGSTQTTDTQAEELVARTKRQREAEELAVLLHRLTDEETGCMILDGADYRRAHFSDITILLRSMTGYAEEFVDTLGFAGIPAYAETRSGFFQTMEIRAVLNYLRILDNPRQDIPLAGVLHAPFVGLSADEMAELRLPEHSYYEGLCAYAETGRNQALRERLSAFLEDFRTLRAQVPHLRVYELLLALFDQTGFPYLAAAMPAGEQRRANLARLLQYALQFEQTGYHGLFGFLRYVEQTLTYELDYGEAGLAAEGGNAVAIMSIHKSKGLEFPIVILAGLGKRINQMDARARVVLHADMGIGLDCVDLTRRTKAPTLKKKVIQKSTVLETLAEELRILYVAMTRAKDKLILSGVVSDREKTLARWAEAGGRMGEKMEFAALAGASTYFDWIGPVLFSMRQSACDSGAAMRDDKAGAVTAARLFSASAAFHEAEEAAFSLLLPDTMPKTARVMHQEEQLSQEAFRQWMAELPEVSPQESSLYQVLHWPYAFAPYLKLPVRLTVTELKRRLAPDEEAQSIFRNEDEQRSEAADEQRQLLDAKKPQLEAEAGLQAETLRRDGVSGLSGAARGTLYHSVLQRLPFATLSPAQVASYLDDLRDEGFLTKEARAALSATAFARLLDSPLGVRLRAADARGRLYRERPFVFGVPAMEFLPAGTEMPPAAQQELMLIQGVIDAYFEEEDALVLVDYKTDRAMRTEEGKQALVKRYQTQLDYYTRALEGMTGKRVKERLLYSFALSCEIVI